MQGRTVRLFLVDGSPAGLVTAEIMNWTGHALLTPRSRLAEALSRSEAGRTGVYFLIGEDPESFPRSKIYVGEGDEVRSRIKRHAEDEKKEFWTRTCMITSSDKNLTKAHVRYLEGRLIELAKAANRAALENNTSPDVKGLLPESDTSDMEYFLTQIQVVLPVMGIDVLRPKPSANQDIQASPENKNEMTPDTVELELNIKKYGYKAKAVEREGEITVLKGSTALANPQHQTNNYASLREQLMAAGTLVLEKGQSEFLIFKEDYTFNSPSAAAAVINGRNTNGRTAWTILETGKTLKEYQDEQLSQASAKWATTD